MRHDGAVVNDDEAVVHTPLDLIARLEREERAISTVVLMGRFAVDCVLAGFLRETYPHLDVRDAPHGSAADDPDVAIAIPRGQ